MKSLFLFIFFSIINSASNAQTSVYHPFPDSNAVWTVARTFLSGPCSLGPHTEIFSYTFSGDTSIKGNTYHKIVIPYVQSLDTCPPLDPTTGYAGCISQDTAAKKVYFISPNDTTRQIIYDFSLGIGGKYDLPNPISSLCYSGVDSIISMDSVLIGANYRKRWNAWADIAPSIEGIGFIRGLLHCCSATDGPYYGLYCFSQNGITLYPNGDSSCNVILSNRYIQQTRRGTNVSPNPFHTSAELEINIEEIGMGNLYLHIFDLTGRVVFQQMINSQTTTINRNSLLDGIYFYNVQSIKGEMAKGKIIIN